MPIYVFQCNDCSNKFEILVKMSDDKLPICPECNSLNVKQLPAKPNLKFNGSGFYATDYKDE